MAKKPIETINITPIVAFVDKIPYVQPTFEDEIPMRRVRSYLCIDHGREKTWRDDEE